MIVSCVDSADATGFREPIWLEMGNEAANGQVVLGELAGGRHGTLGQRLPRVVDLFPELRSVDDDDEGPS